MSISSLLWCGFLSFMILYWLAWIAVLSVMIHFEKNPIFNNMDLSYLYQISPEWKAQPYIDFIITENRQCPATHPHEMFYDLWPGATILCDCIDRS